MREMKEAMVKKSGDMTFWPVTMKDPEQLELEIGEGKPYPTLQEHLHPKYTGRTLTFEELLTTTIQVVTRGSSRITVGR